MAAEKIEKVVRVKQKSGVQQEPLVDRIAPNKEKFDSLVKNSPAEHQRISADQAQKNLLEEVRDINSKVDRIGSAHPSLIANQADEIIAQIDTIKESLSSPNLQIKGSVQTLMRNKLMHIDDALKVTLDRAGLEYIPAEQRVVKDFSNPIERFLGSLTDAQSKLETLTTDVSKWHDQDRQISPATMLALQIKVGFIQSELEFFASLLNKSLESTKTIMNVQV